MVISPEGKENKMQNWERFEDRHDAEAAHAAEKVVFGCGWGVLEWLYMDYIPDEPRIDYLLRLRDHGILKAEGFKELRRLAQNIKEAKDAKEE